MCVCVCVCVCVSVLIWLRYYSKNQSPDTNTCSIFCSGQDRALLTCPWT